MCGQIASNLNVDVSTVWRIVKPFQEAGSVDKKEYDKAYRKLTTPLQLIRLHLMLERPGVYLREIHSGILDPTGAGDSGTTLPVTSDQRNY